MSMNISVITFAKEVIVLAPCVCLSLCKISRKVDDAYFAVAGCVSTASADYILEVIRIAIGIRELLKEFYH